MPRLALVSHLKRQIGKDLSIMFFRLLGMFFMFFMFKI